MKNTTEARQAFREANHAAVHRSDYWTGERDVEGEKTNFDKTLKAGAAIERAVELPSIGIPESELEAIRKPQDTPPASAGA